MSDLEQQLIKLASCGFATPDANDLKTLSQLLTQVPKDAAQSYVVVKVLHELMNSKDRFVPQEALEDAQRVVLELRGAQLKEQVDLVVAAMRREREDWACLFLEQLQHRDTHTPVDPVLKITLLTSILKHGLYDVVHSGWTDMDHRLVGGALGWLSRDEKIDFLNQIEDQAWWDRVELVLTLSPFEGCDEVVWQGISQQYPTIGSILSGKSIREHLPTPPATALAKKKI